MCIKNLEECVTRFPEHYKSIYRLVLIYLNAPERIKNVEKCRQLLMGTYTTALNNQIQGLFSDRKTTNLFNVSQLANRVWIGLIYCFIRFHRAFGAIHHLRSIVREVFRRIYRNVCTFSCKFYGSTSTINCYWNWYCFCSGFLRPISNNAYNFNLIKIIHWLFCSFLLDATSKKVIVKSCLIRRCRFVHSPSRISSNSTAPISVTMLNCSHSFWKSTMRTRNVWKMSRKKNRSSRPWWWTRTKCLFKIKSLECPNLHYKVTSIWLRNFAFKNWTQRRIRTQNDYRWMNAEQLVRHPEYLTFHCLDWVRRCLARQITHFWLPVRRHHWLCQNQ